MSLGTWSGEGRAQGGGCLRRLLSASPRSIIPTTWCRAPAATPRLAWCLHLCPSYWEAPSPPLLSFLLLTLKLHLNLQSCPRPQVSGSQGTHICFSKDTRDLFAFSSFCSGTSSSSWSVLIGFQVKSFSELLLSLGVLLSPGGGTLLCRNGCSLSSWPSGCCPGTPGPSSRGSPSGATNYPVSSPCLNCTHLDCAQAGRVHSPAGTEPAAAPL